jgi:hypothetical protein
MKKLLILLTILLSFTFCKGPGSGPLVKESFTKENKSQGMESQSHKAPVQTEKITVSIEPCDGCITISKLFESKQSFSGKSIKVKGQVTKFNPQIMGKNWVHLQDGTESEGLYDLTVTTDKEVSVGDVITFEGKIALDKDFGYGYFYSVLMEEAKPVL